MQFYGIPSPPKSLGADQKNKKSGENYKLIQVPTVANGV